MLATMLQKDFKAVRISTEKVSCEISKLGDRESMVSWWSDHGQSWSVTMINHGQMMVNHGLTANMSQG